VRLNANPFSDCDCRLDNAQSLHHFLTESPWQIDAFRQHRLKLILQTLERESWSLMTQATVRKGITDYVKRQYIGNLGKIEWDCCCYCLWSHREHYGSFALRGLQTKERLKPADIYRSKPEIAAGMIRELKAMGFRFKLVLADSLYGESGCGFINVLYELKLDFVVLAITRSGCRVSKRFAAIDGASLSACSAMVN